MAVALCIAVALLAAPTSAGAANWGAPVALATPSEYFPWEPRPEVAMSGAGAVAIWEQVEGARESVWTANMSSTGSWSPAVRMPTTTWYEKGPQIAINETGEAVAVWEAIAEQAVVMAAVRSPSGQWGPAVPISPEGSTYTNLDVAVGPSGEAVAAWCQVPRYGSPRGYRIEAAIMSADGQWREAKSLSSPADDSYSPRVAISPDGRILATWDGFYSGNNTSTVQVAEVQGGGWTQPHSLTGNYSAWGPQIVAGPTDATVIWETEEGRIEAATKPTGGPWGKPIELSGPESIEPRIGIDAAGNATAIWSSGYGEEGEFIESSTLPAGGGWTEPNEISGPLLVEHTEPALGVGADGETLATWSTWQAGERYVEGTSGASGTWEEPTTLSSAGTWAVRADVGLDGDGDGVVAWWAGDGFLPQAISFAAPRTSPISLGGDAKVPAGAASTSTATPEAGRRPYARAARVATIQKGKVSLQLRCPGPTSCEGEARLLARVSAKKAKATFVTIGKVDFTIAAGDERAVVLALNAVGRHFVAMTGDGGAGVRLRGNGIQARKVLLRRTNARSLRRLPR